MAHSYSKTLDRENESLVASLHAVLQHPNCVTTTWLRNIVESGDFRAISSEDNALYWVDEANEKLSMAFPAILDLTGIYTRIEPYFSLRVGSGKTVRGYIYIYIIGFDIDF